MADTAGKGLQGPEHRISGDAAQPGAELADTGSEGHARVRRSGKEESFQAVPTLPLYPPGPGDRDGWAYMLSVMPEAEPTICRTINGPLSGLDLRLRAVGNGVVPAVAALAFRTLARELKIEGLLKNSTDTRT